MTKGTTAQVHGTTQRKWSGLHASWCRLPKKQPQEKLKRTSPDGRAALKTTPSCIPHHTGSRTGISLSLELWLRFWILPRSSDRFRPSFFFTGPKLHQTRVQGFGVLLENTEHARTDPEHRPKQPRKSGGDHSGNLPEPSGHPKHRSTSPEHSPEHPIRTIREPWRTWNNPGTTSLEPWICFALPRGVLTGSPTFHFQGWKAPSNTRSRIGRRPSVLWDSFWHSAGES